MTRLVNRPENGRPVGEPVPGWTPRQAVRPDVLAGRTCRLESLRPDHHAGLHEALHAGGDDLWTYLSADGPFPDAAATGRWLASLVEQPGAWPLAVVVDGRPAGVACYLRTDPANGCVEIGSIAFSPALQRTTAGTEALVLMARHALGDLGYRRLEWKCDALNAPSVAAALRLGFTPEGVHRQALVTKGRNRDTAWFSVLDHEHEALAAAWNAWLDPANFDAEGRQRTALSDLTAAVRRSHHSPSTGSTSGTNT